MDTRSLKYTTLWLMVVSGLNIVFGYLREVIVAYYYGLSIELETYLVAVSIPNIIGIEVMGIIVTVLLPTYVSIKTKYGDGVATLKARTWTWHVIAITTCGGIAVYLLSPYICYLLAPGFNAEKLAKTTKWMRIAVPITLLLGLSGMVKMVLDSNRKFFFPAFSKGVGSLFFIFVCIALSKKISGVNLVWAMLASTLVILFFSSIPIVSKFSSKEDKNHLENVTYVPENNNIFNLIVIVGLNSLIFHFYSLIDRAFASTLADGSIAILNYGNLLVNVPYTIFSLVIATVIFPELSERFAEKDHSRSIALTKKALLWCAFAYIIVSIVLIIFSRPFVSLLLQRGNFTVDATRSVAMVLTILAISLVPGGLWNIMSTYFRSQNLHIYLLHVASFVLVGKFILNSMLVRYGVNGLACSSVITTWLGYVYLQYKYNTNVRALRA